MANAARGEVEVVVNGTPYTWRLTTHAACALEARTGQTLGTVLAGADTLGMRALRDLVWVLLQAYHAPEFDTIEAVETWIDDAGILPVMQHLRRLLELNQPQTGGAAQAAASPPPGPPAGTGDGSSLRLAG